MTFNPDGQRGRRPVLVYWLLWAAQLLSLVLIYVLLARGPAEASPPGDVLIDLAGLVPLFVSIVIRWLVLPRYDDLARLLPVFILGLALAEACGIVGLFLGGAYRDDLFALSVLGVLQFVPLFARRLLEPKGSGFIPNN